MVGVVTAGIDAGADLALVGAAAVRDGGNLAGAVGGA